MGTGSFLGVKRPGRGADHPPPSKCRGQERVGLYLYSPSGLSWPVMGAPLAHKQYYVNNKENRGGLWYRMNASIKVGRHVGIQATEHSPTGYQIGKYSAADQEGKRIIEMPLWLYKQTNKMHFLCIYSTIFVQLYMFRKTISFIIRSS